MRKLIMENGTELILFEHCSEVGFSGNDFSGENTSDKEINYNITCEGKITIEEWKNLKEYAKKQEQLNS